MEGKKFEQLDSLRFFAVMIVVCQHWQWFGFNMLGRIISGGRGVDLFFVISGFLITLGLIRSKFKDQSTGTSLYKFYVRRALRIFPVYYLTLFVVWCMNPGKLAGAIWWYIFYASNFYSIRMHDWGPIGHLWSLAVEEQFYLVWPFIILLTPRRFLVLVIVTAIIVSQAATVRWHLMGPDYFWSLYMHPLGALHALAIGALLAYCYYFHEERLRAVLYNPYVVMFVFAEMIICQFSRESSFNILYYSSARLCFSIFSAWLIGRAVFTFTGFWGFVLDMPALRYVGRISYAIYLFHPIVSETLWPLLHISNPNVSFLVYAVVTLSLASVSWYAFESQLLKLKARFE